MDVQATFLGQELKSDLIKKIKKTNISPRFKFFTKTY